MDARGLNEMLDGFEYSLISMDGEGVQSIRDVITDLRNNSKTRVTGDIDVIVAKLWSSVEFLISGRGINRKTIIDLKKKIPTIDTGEIIDKGYIIINGKAVSEEVVQSSINMLKLALEDIQSEDEVESRKIIDSAIKSYSSYNYQDQGFDMKIVEAQYELIKKYLQNGKIEEAIDYVKKFDTDFKHFAFDMKKFVFEKMQAKMNEITENQLNKRSNENNLPRETKILLADYLSGINEIEPTKIGLWKTMMELEINAPFELITPEIEVRDEKEESSEKNSDNKAKETDEEFEIITIRYDAKGPGGINKKDFEKLEKKLRNKKILGDKEVYFAKQKKIKIIFEDGITKIPDMKIEKTYDDMNTQLVEEVKLPEGLVSIGNAVFAGFSNLKRINIPNSIEDLGESTFEECGIEKLDLSKTNIKEIKKRTFYNSKIKEMKMPQELEKVEKYAFAYTSELEKVDFLDTKLIELDEGAFYKSNVRRVRASKKLMNISDFCFQNSSLEYFDAGHLINGVRLGKYAFRCETTYRGHRFSMERSCYSKYSGDYYPYGIGNYKSKFWQIQVFDNIDWDSFDWCYSDDIEKENQNNAKLEVQEKTNESKSQTPDRNVPTSNTKQQEQDTLQGLIDEKIDYDDLW